MGVCVVVLASLLSSCATVRGWMPGKGKKHDKAAVETAGETIQSPDAASREAALRDAVASEIAAAKRAEAAQDRVIRRRPYFLKEYSTYPAPDTLDITMHELESRSRPYAADVRVEKERFYTQMHRSRKNALEDETILRQTGTETMSFEWRDGHWHRVGGVFVAENPETRQGGEWVAVEEGPVAQSAVEEEKPGWFSRQWRRITGKN